MSWLLAALAAQAAWGQTPPAAPVTHAPAPSAAPAPKAKPVQPHHQRVPVVQARPPIHAERPAHAGGAKAAARAGAAAPAALPAKPPQAVPEHPAEPPKGTATGLPLPRFAALRSDEVNLRAGPGTRYPIDWVYKRRDLPVQIEREFEVWRLVADPDGVKGWVHQATLTGRRSFIVVGAERTLRQSPDDGAPPVALLKPGVIGHIRHCDAKSDWCRVQVSDYRGWLRRSEFWGSFEGEEVD